MMNFIMGGTWVEDLEITHKPYWDEILRIPKRGMWNESKLEETHICIVMPVADTAGCCGGVSPSKIGGAGGENSTVKKYLWGKDLWGG